MCPTPLWTWSNVVAPTVVAANPSGDTPWGIRIVGICKYTLFPKCVKRLAA